MKRVLLAALLLLLAGGTVARAADVRPASRHAKRTAIEFFEAGNSAAAVAHVKSSLAPEAIADGARVALTQGLIEIASTLYNERRLTLAREVLTHAFKAAQPILNGTSPAPAARRGGVISSLGVLSEHVALDLKRAETLYAAAAALNPGDPLHRERLRVVTEKQKRRGGSAAF